MTLVDNRSDVDLKPRSCHLLLDGHRDISEGAAKNRELTDAPGLAGLVLSRPLGPPMVVL
jgi:hypothetical protein